MHQKFDVFLDAFLIEKKLQNWSKNDPKLGAPGGSNEPAFRSLNPCWEHPGAQRDPRAPQGKPWDPPETQKVQKLSSKPSKIIEK